MTVLNSREIRETLNHLSTLFQEKERDNSTASSTVQPQKSPAAGKKKRTLGVEKGAQKKIPRTNIAVQKTSKRNSQKQQGQGQTFPRRSSRKTREKEKARQSDLKPVELIRFYYSKMVTAICLSLKNSNGFPPFHHECQNQKMYF